MARERATLDLGELAPLIRAAASARGLTRSAFVRAAVGRMLDNAGVGSREPELDGPDESPGRDRIKVSVRMTRAAAQTLSERAASLALSVGSYIGAVLDGAPNPPAADLGRAVLVLAESTDGLAVLSSDLRQLIRECRQRDDPRSAAVGKELETLARAVRLHLVAAAAALTLLRPIAESRRRALRADEDGLRS